MPEYLMKTVVTDGATTVRMTADSEDDCVRMTVPEGHLTFPADELPAVLSGLNRLLTFFNDLGSKDEG